MNAKVAKDTSPWFEEELECYFREIAPSADTSFAHEWGYRDKVQAEAQTLLAALTAARNFARLVGVPSGTEITFAEEIQVGAACAGFYDRKFKRPFILIDARVVSQRMSRGTKEAIETTIGLALHEAMHILHSREIYRRMRHRDCDNLLNSLENLLEDHRIEKILLEDSPSLSRYIYKIRESLVIREWLDVSVKQWNRLTQHQCLLTIIGAYIRAPLIIQNNPFLLEYRDILGRIVFQELCQLLPHPPRTEREVADQASKLFCFIQEHWQAWKGTPMPSESERNTDPNGRGERESTEEDVDETINKGLVVGLDEEDDWESETNQQDEISMDEDVCWREPGKPADHPVTEDEHSALEAQWIRDNKYSYPSGRHPSEREPIEGWQPIFREFESNDTSNSPGDDTDPGQRSTFEDACLADGRVLTGITKQQAAEVKRLLAKQSVAGERDLPAGQRLLEQHLPKQHLPEYVRGKITLELAPVTPEGSLRYQEAKQGIRYLISHLRNVFPIPNVSSRRYRKNRSRGRLDSARLYRASYGNEIFRTRCLMENQETILVCLLLDASTSMDDNKRCERTLEMAVLFNETFAGHPEIDLHIFSHSTEIGSEGCLLLRHGCAREARTVAKIGNYRTYRANYDYQAIWGVVACMSKEAATTSQRYLLVISDGLPCLPRKSAGSGVEITRQSVSEVRRLGWKVVGIGIDDYHGTSIYGSNWTVNVSASRLTVEACRLLKWLVHRS